MAESFLYDPTETINKGFAQFQAGLGNAFAQIIAQKQNDYVTAEKTFQNIDALTDKLGEYGQEEIIGKTKDLMAQASKDIIKDGKLDYSALGTIRSGVTQIKNRKSAIEAGTAMLKEWTQTALASKDDLTSLTTTLGDLRGILLNPNNLSAADMGRQMQAAYTKNINSTKVLGDIFKQVTPATEFTETVEKDGNRYQVGGFQVSGYQYDKASGKFVETGAVPMIGADGQPVKNPDGSVKMVSKVQQAIETAKAQGAPAIAALRMQMGPAAATLTDDQLVASQFQRYVENNNRANKEILIKDKNELSISESNAKISEAKAKNINTEIALGNERDRAAIEASRSTTLKNKAEMDALNGNGALSTTDVNPRTNTKTTFLGKRIPIIGKDANGQPVNMIVTDKVWENGREYYSGYKAPRTMGYVEANTSNISGFQPTKIPVDSYNSKSFNAGINTIKGKSDKIAVNKALNEYNNTTMSPVKFNEPTAQQKERAKKEGRVIISMQQIRRDDPSTDGMSNDQLYKAIVESSKGSKVLIIK